LKSIEVKLIIKSNQGHAVTVYYFRGGDSMCDWKGEEEMSMLQQELDQKKKNIDTRKIDAILKQGIKRYDKALEKLAKN